MDGIPNIVLIGVPNEQALRRAKQKLDEHKIAYYAWEEPDGDLGFTAIATEPIDSKRKEALAHYRLWKASNTIPSSSAKERAVLSGEVGGSSPSWGANGPCAKALVKSQTAHQHAEVAQLPERPCVP